MSILIPKVGMRTVKTAVSVGVPPAPTPAAPGQEHDNLEDLLALGQRFDSIIIKE